MTPADKKADMAQAVPTGSRRPHFDKPPVIEVICGVQFQPLRDWRTSYYGLYWTAIKNEYPNTEDHPPLGKLKLDEKAPEELQVAILPPLRRAFFVTEPGNYLIQVQPNRFLHNWRKLSDEEEYPRYEDAYARFVTQWDGFQQFVRKVGLSTPQPEVYELTYINHIMEADSAFPRDVWKYLSFYNQNPLSDPAYEPSDIKMHFSWPLGEGTGSLLMEVKRGRRLSDERELLYVEFTARGPAQKEAADMATWFDIAHDAIVNSFDKLTTEHGHTVWEKRE